jgi:hypothetical protein
MASQTLAAIEQERNNMRLLALVQVMFVAGLALNVGFLAGCASSPASAAPVSDEGSQEISVLPAASPSGQASEAAVEPQRLPAPTIDPVMELPAAMAVAAPADPVASENFRVGSDSDPLNAVDELARASGAAPAPAPYNPMAALMGSAGTASPVAPGLAKPVTVAPVAPVRPARRTYRVLATAEGLIGGVTASGHVISMWSQGAALPHTKALGKKLVVNYLTNSRNSTVKVLDVGPWNIDDAYWEKASGKPQAESGRDRFGRRTNKAGIDLFNATWYKLLALRTYDRRLIENTSGNVEWAFAD